MPSLKTRYIAISWVIALSGIACDPLEGTAVAPVPISDAQQYRASVLSDAPIGYWRVFESDPSQAMADETDYGRNGSYSPEAVLGVPGPLVVDPTFEIAPTAGGILGLSNFASLPNSVAIPSNSPWAVEMWINVSSAFASGSLNLLSWSSGCTSLTYNPVSHSLNGTVANASGVSTALSFDMSLDLDQWVYLAWAIDPKLGNQVLYLNGLSVAQVALPGGPSPELSAATLGGATDGQAWFAVSELAIFSGTLPGVDSWMTRYNLAGY